MTTCSAKRSCLLWGMATTAAFCLTQPVEAATNLVVNGSFEGADGLTGWTIGGVAKDGYLPVAIKYNQASPYPTGAQYESVRPDDASSLSPDLSGNKGVYFVSDQDFGLSLYQYVHLDPGSYDIGFDSFDTYNGSVQPHDATFTATILNVQVANFALSSVSPGSWSTHSGVASISTTGDYLVAFTFNTPDTPLDSDPSARGPYNAKDVVIDRAYVVADPNGGGVAIPSVPEPATWSMMILGLGSVGFAMRRRPTQRVIAEA